MKKQETIFDFFGKVFLLFGVTVLLLLVISQVLGNDVKDDTVMFSLGNEGLPTATLLQFLSIAFIISTLNVVFTSEKIIKSGSNGLRIIGLLGSIIIVMSLYIYFFQWFPLNNVESWLMFFGMFAISFGGSVGIVFTKEKLENKQMEEGLNRIKAELEADADVKNH